MFEKRVTGYCDRLCAQPGEKIEFKVSCDEPGPFTADIVRILSGDDHPGGPGLRYDLCDTTVSGVYEGQRQTTHPGSCVIVPDSPPMHAAQSFTVSVAVHPTLPANGVQVLLSHWAAHGPGERGFELRINARGKLELEVANGRGSRRLGTDVALDPHRWSWVGGSYDGETGRATLWQRRLSLSAANDAHSLDLEATAEWPAGAYASALGAGFALATRWLDRASPRAHGQFHFNGKLDSPRWLNCARHSADPDLLYAPSIPGSLRSALVGWWDFARGIDSETVIDVSGNSLHGRTHQLPTRAVTGFNWTGNEPRWQHAPNEYGAIHFHDDDLIDAQWDTSFEFVVPSDFPSGVYAARIQPKASSGDVRGDDLITFFVRPPRGTTTAKTLFLVPSASYLAYSNSRLHLRPSKIFGGEGVPEYENDAYLHKHPEFGGSLYDMHSDRSGIHYTSHHRPVQNLKPGQNRPWCFSADANIIDWLDRVGVDFDVLTDEELHHEGVGALSQYSAVITGTHPEYYSTPMLDAVDGYLRAGGRLMYMGGNGFYWRIAFHPTRRGTIEVRRAEDGTRAWIAQPGEYYHSFNGEYGGLWRRIGRPPNRLVGVGFAAQGFAASSYYRKGPDAADPKVGFVFDGVDDDIIGDFGSIGNGAAGEEIDRYDRFLGSPAHAWVLASSEAHDDAMLRTKEEFLSTVPSFDDPKIRADMVLFETANGGAVFSAGSITWAASLSHNNYDNNVSRITENVLRRFLQPAAL